MKNLSVLFRILTIALIVIVMSACVIGSDPAAGETKIVIFHINDVHARVGNFARIARLLQAERARNPHVFFLDAGDNFSGDPYVDLYEPKGEPIVRLLNRLQCDAQVLGNHDFDYDQEALKQYMERAAFPVICANVEVISAKIDQPKPYTVLKTANGIRIAVLGLLQVGRDSGLPDTLPARVAGLRFSDPLNAAGKYKNLKKKNHVFMALTHLGLSTDEYLAKQMGELDLIVGSHSHTVIEAPTTENGVLIAQAGAHADYLGRIDLTVKDGVLTEKKGALIDLKTVDSEDPEIKAMVKEFYKNPVLDREITRLSVPLKGKTELGNLITDAIRRALSLDIAFHNSGGIRVDELKGSVRYRDVYAMHPFGNVVVVLNMTAAEIRGLIQYDYERRKETDLQVSGIDFTVKRTGDHRVKAVEIKTREGGQLAEDKTYRVGMNNFMVTSYKFPHQDPGTSSEMKIADIMVQHLKKGVDAAQYKGKVRIHEQIVNGEE